MSRHFFDLPGSPKDVHGVEFADDAVARQEAVPMARSNGHLLPTFGTSDAVVVRTVKAS